MSIAGYLGARKLEARMPKKCAEQLGARFEGAVLAGEKSVEEQLRQVVVSPGGEYYERVEDYDPVLRAHCRV